MAKGKEAPKDTKESSDKFDPKAGEFDITKAPTGYRSPGGLADKEAGLPDPKPENEEDADLNVETDETPDGDEDEEPKVKATTPVAKANLDA